MNEGKNEVSPPGREEILCLTLNRSSQQARGNDKRTQLRDAAFTMLDKPPRGCKRYPLALLRFQNNILKSVQYLWIPCNSWRCPICAPQKAKQAMNLLRGVIILNEMRYFLTLTLDPKSISDQYKNRTHKYLLKIFNAFLTSIRRIQKDLKYVWVPEYQKNGNAHLHIVLNTRLDIKIVRKIWIRVGGGAQCYIEYIRDIMSVANYISKYIGKNMNNTKYMRHFERRFGISRSCIRPSKVSKPFYPELNNFQKQSLLHNQGNGWVYNRLLKGDFIDGEKISAPEIPL